MGERVVIGLVAVDSEHTPLRPSLQFLYCDTTSGTHLLLRASLYSVLHWLQRIVQIGYIRTLISDYFTRILLRIVERFRIKYEISYFII